MHAVGTAKAESISLKQFVLSLVKQMRDQVGEQVSNQLLKSISIQEIGFSVAYAADSPMPAVPPKLSLIAARKFLRLHDRQAVLTALHLTQLPPEHLCRLQMTIRLSQ